MPSEARGNAIVTPSSPIADHVPAWLDPGLEDERLRLHLGGWQVRPGWKILNIQQRPGVDFIGDCCDLSRFAAGSVSAVYASHVLEHLSHQGELPRALAEIRRIMIPDGILLMSVPDLEILCSLFLDKTLDTNERLRVMSMMFGGQVDSYDFHKVGLWREYVAYLLRQAGFRRVNQVPEFGIFSDASRTTVRGRSISLNLIVN